jgi:hypothetical protein
MTKTTTRMPWILRLAGRCADGAERGKGIKTHVVLAAPGINPPAGGAALCGAKPGRLSAGWVEVDGPEVPTCPRCQRRAALLAPLRCPDCGVTFSPDQAHICQPALTPVQSFGDLVRRAATDPRYAQLVLLAAANLGGRYHAGAYRDLKAVASAIGYLRMNAQEADDENGAGLLAEVNAVRDSVTVTDTEF